MDTTRAKNEFIDDACQVNDKKRKRKNQIISDSDSETDAEETQVYPNDADEQEDTEETQVYPDDASEQQDAEGYEDSGEETDPYQRASDEDEDGNLRGFVDDNIVYSDTEDDDEPDKPSRKELQGVRQSIRALEDYAEFKSVENATMQKSLSKLLRKITRLKKSTSDKDKIIAKMKKSMSDKDKIIANLIGPGCVLTPEEEMPAQSAQLPVCYSNREDSN